MAKPSVRFLLCLAALACSTAALADARAPAAAALPTPPGGQLMLDLALSDADLLPAIKQALPALAATLPPLMGAPDEFPDGFPIKPADVETIFRDVESIEAVVSAVGPQDGGAPGPAVAQFYEGELAKQGWRRLFWMQPDERSRILVMAPKAEPGLFGLLAIPADGGKTCTAIAFRLRGTIDLAPVVGLAVFFFGARASFEAAPPPPAEH
jgi:hypothetical protein